MYVLISTYLLKVSRGTQVSLKF